MAFRPGLDVDELEAEVGLGGVASVEADHVVQGLHLAGPDQHGEVGHVDVHLGAGRGDVGRDRQVHRGHDVDGGVAEAHATDRQVDGLVERRQPAVLDGDVAQLGQHGRGFADVKGQEDARVEAAHPVAEQPVVGQGGARLRARRYGADGRLGRGDDERLYRFELGVEDEQRGQEAAEVGEIDGVERHVEVDVAAREDARGPGKLEHLKVDQGLVGGGVRGAGAVDEGAPGGGGGQVRDGQRLETGAVDVHAVRGDLIIDVGLVKPDFRHLDGVD